MTSKERMMLALRKEKPDRVPVTVHQWQGYHLQRYMDGISELEAFKAVGMDAAVQYFEAMGQFWVPDAEAYLVSTPQWRDEAEVLDPNPLSKIIRHTVTTPDGALTYETGGNPTTTWIREYLIKRHEDVDLIARYMPVPQLNRERVTAAYDAVGDAGILRGWVWGDQASCWQHACCLMDIQKLIVETFDNPDWVHYLLQTLLDKKLQFIEGSLTGAKFDLIETGGGSGSDTVISPALHREFCLPYDRRLHRELHRAGQMVTYHTCGGMMHILDLIVANETDASETLSPPGVGGNITEPDKVREAFGGHVAMIGGMDQFHVLTNGTPEQIRAEVHRLFDGFGKAGGYILSCSDHFFDAPVENLKAFADAANECVY